VLKNLRLWNSCFSSRRIGLTASGGAAALATRAEKTCSFDSFDLVMCNSVSLPWTSDMSRPSATATQRGSLPKARRKQWIHLHLPCRVQPTSH